MKKYKVICLCGSTRYKAEFEKVNADLTLAGNVVISVGYFHHVEKRDIDVEKAKIQLDDIHRQKISMSDEVFVINPEGYIGDSTRAEIKYAKSLRKPVKYMVAVDESVLFNDAVQSKDTKQAKDTEQAKDTKYPLSGLRLAKDIAFEIVFGGDRFSKQDIKDLFIYDGFDEAAFRENIKKEVEAMLPEGHDINSDYYQKAIMYWSNYNNTFA